MKGTLAGQLIFFVLIGVLLAGACLQVSGDYDVLTRLSDLTG